MALGDRRRTDRTAQETKKQPVQLRCVTGDHEREVLNIKWSICYVSACEKKYHWYGLKFFLPDREGCRKLRANRMIIVITEKSKKYYTKCNP